MSGDQIAGSVGIAAMLFLVVHRLTSDQLPGRKMLWLALAWVAIFAVAAAIVLAVRPQP